jgi:hypothetical protein
MPEIKAFVACFNGSAGSQVYFGDSPTSRALFRKLTLGSGAYRLDRYCLCPSESSTSHIVLWFQLPALLFSFVNIPNERE